MKCILCGSEEIQTVDTVVSDFVMARIDPGFQQHGRNIPTKLCFCKSCTLLMKKRFSGLYNG